MIVLLESIGDTYLKNIPWEKTSNEIPAQLVQSRTKVPRASFVVKALAKAKMLDVTLISAEFNTIPVVFEERMSVYLDWSTHSEFLGVYQPGYMEEEEKDHLPTICIRHATWNKARDFRQFNEAKSKKAYVEGSEQIISRIIFTTAKQEPDISRLILSAKQVIRTGIAINEVSRPDFGMEEIRFSIADESIVFTLSYTPIGEQCIEMEKWLPLWQSGFAKLDNEKGIIPDDGCRISYSDSLKERFNAFPE